MGGACCYKPRGNISCGGFCLRIGERMSSRIMGLGECDTAAQEIVSVSMQDGMVSACAAKSGFLRLDFLHIYFCGLQDSLQDSTACTR